MAERYPAPVVTRFRQPRFVQTSDSPPAVAAGAHGARAAGGRVEIHLGFHPDGTLAARFRAYGDPATIAAADWLCEQLDGGEVPGKPLSAPEILRALSLPRRSANAAFLAEQALNEALGRLTGGSCPG